MTVYVDDMRAKFGLFVMCHMIADSTDELLSMADRIEVPRRYIQHVGTPKEHFDICLSKRRLAVKAGAVQITLKETANLMYVRAGINVAKLHADQTALAVRERDAYRAEVALMARSDAHPHARSIAAMLTARVQMRMAGGDRHG